MAKVLVVYATSEGQTKKICDRVAEWIRKAGHQADLFDSTNLDMEVELSQYQAFVLAGSLHVGKHQGCLADFARNNRIELNKKPAVFLSVSLSAAGKDEKHLADCQKCIDGFLADTGLRPLRSMPVAGALMYTQYDFITKQFMRMIAVKEGGDADTSRDYEYTDWDALESFIDGFLADAVASKPSAKAAPV